MAKIVLVTRLSEAEAIKCILCKGALCRLFNPWSYELKIFVRKLIGCRRCEDRVKCFRSRVTMYHPFD